MSATGFMAPCHALSRAWTEEERQEARDRRERGESNAAISRAMNRGTQSINKQIGRPAPRPSDHTARGLRKKRQVERERNRVHFGRGTDLRTPENGFALPAGSPESWGAISSERWPLGGVTCP